MALEAVVHPQHQGRFGYGPYYRDSPYALPWCDTDCTLGFGDWDPLLLASLVQNAEWEDVGDKASPPEQEAAPPAAQQQAVAVTTTTRRKRRRAKVVKNEEEIESQRMTHIAVERNRRRQMNDYLAVLRSLMPPSYAQRGDQASIVGGAINYVRELEQHLQCLEAQKNLREHCDEGTGDQSPFAGFFSFPQYHSTASSSHCGAGGDNAHRVQADAEPTAGAAADIEASMAEGHASVKVQAPRRPGQLLRLVAGLQQRGLTTLHLSVTTAGAMVMYSFGLKVEDECKLSSMEEIATAVHEILGRVQEEAGFS
ncbi:hypothetical protein ACP4OV_011104 [Aristida adscensionis]